MLHRHETMALIKQPGIRVPRERVQPLAACRFTLRQAEQVRADHTNAVLEARLPFAASIQPRLNAVVVLLTPPLWLNSEIWMAIRVLP